MDDRLLETQGRDGQAGQVRLRMLLARWRRDPEAARVLALVASARGVPASSLLGNSRGRAETAAARQLAMYLTHVLCHRTLTDVGRLFGRDRTTVSHACALMEDRRDDPGFEAEVEALERRLEGGIGMPDHGELRHARH